MKYRKPKKAYTLPVVALASLSLLMTGLAAWKLPQARADARNATDFVMTVDTSGSATSPRSFTIPTIGAGHNYNYTVDCDNDGTLEAQGLTGNYTCTYPQPGRYTIRIGGSFSRIYFNNGGDRLKLRSIDQWGTSRWTSMERAFFGATQMDVKAADTPDLSQANNLAYMFANVTGLKGETANWNWDTSQVTNLNATFLNTPQFNQPLKWNTSRVSNFNSTFSGATIYNQPLQQWDMSSATDLSFMFANATAFNQPLDSWRTAKVQQIRSTFLNAKQFNQSLAAWDVSAVTAAADALSRSGLSLENYDATLMAWDAQDLKPGVALGATGLTYCAAETARSHMVTADTWAITGDTKQCPSFAVHFDSQSGSAVADQPTVYHELLAQPAAPTRHGYAFAGWYRDAGLAKAWDFATDRMPARELTLYAKWTAITPNAPDAPIIPTPPTSEPAGNLAAPAPGDPASRAATASSAGPTQTSADRLSDTGHALWMLPVAGVLLFAGGVLIMVRRRTTKRTV